MTHLNVGVFCATVALVLGCSGDDLVPEGSAPEGTGVVQQAVTLPALNANADTELRKSTPFANYGTATTLRVTSASIVDLRRSLIKFDPAAITSAVGGQALYSARIDLTISGISAGWLGGQIEIMPMTRTWVEGTGLLGNGPSWVCAHDTNTTLLGNLVNNCAAGNNWGMAPTDPYPLPFNTAATDRAPIFTGGVGTLSLDVTRDVQRFLNGEPNHGWILAGTGGPMSGEWVNFGSRQSANPPKLILDVGPDQCVDDPLKGAPGQCGCGVPDVDANLDGVKDCFDAALAVTADTTVRLAVPFGNDGTGTLLGVTSASVAGLERTLVRLDQPALDTARAGRDVERAYLELTVAGIALGWGGGRIEILPMTRSWPEGNGLAGHGPSWYCADDQNTTLLGNAFNDCLQGDNWGMMPWQLLPIPFSTPATDSEQIFWPGTRSVRFDVTADLKRFIAGDPNHGWIIKGTEDLLSGQWVNFGSRESGAPPILLIDWLDDCPHDPAKVLKGQCGCSIPDVDFDGDTVADCIDACAADNAKSQPGLCGCGRSEADDDNDGLVNCVDGCPTDDTNADCIARDGLPDPINFPEDPGSNSVPERDFDLANCTPESGALDQNAPQDGDAILNGTPSTGLACGPTYDQGACPLDPNEVTSFTCDSDADCVAAGLPAGYVCGWGIPTSECSVATPPPGVCGSKTKRCGIPDQECVNDPAPDGCTDPASCPCLDPNSPSCGCVEVDLCPDDGWTGTAEPAPGSYTPEVFPTPAGIAEERVLPPEPVYIDPRDGPCRRQPISGSCWCALGMDNPGAVPVTQSKPGEHGGGSLLTLSFRPEIDFTVDLEPLPFGDARFTATAGAKFVANATIDFSPAPRQSLDLIDLNAGVAADRCSFSTAGAHFKVFEVDFVDLFTNEQFDSTEALETETDDCQGAVSDFVEAGDRAKKALRDAQVLLERYNALPGGQTFTKESFCDSQVDDSQDADFPPGDCMNDPIETTINRYVSYYDIRISALRSEMQQLADASHHLTQALDDVAPNSSIRFLDFGREESETIASVTFFVGPIPVNITMDVGLAYGVDGDLVYRFSPAQGLGLAGGSTTQIMAVAGKLIPSAAATFQVFAGVGIDLGVVAVKAGISGELTLAQIQANLESGVGLSLAAVDDDREIPDELEALGTGARLFPTREYEFYLDWFYGARLGLTDVLKGSLSAKVKLKAFFFSKTFRKPFLTFPSPFNLPDTQLMSGGARLAGIPLPVSSGSPESSLGVYEMELPFVDVTPLPIPADALDEMVAFDLGDEELHFDDICNLPPIP